MDDKLKISELNGRWSVGFNDREIVAFAGPDARASAERQWSELSQLLSVTHTAPFANDSAESNHDGNEPRPSSSSLTSG
jgi:hypothetical protein